MLGFAIRLKAVGFLFFFQRTVKSSEFRSYPPIKKN